MAGLRHVHLQLVHSLRCALVLTEIFAVHAMINDTSEDLVHDGCRRENTL